LQVFDFVRFVHDLLSEQGLDHILDGGDAGGTAIGVRDERE
jgi:hypothetical protein